MTKGWWRIRRRGGARRSPADDKGLVAHTQAGMAALLAVRARPAPVLDQEKGEPLGGGRQVLFRVDGTQDRVLRHARVEAPHEQPEGFLTARELVHAAVQHFDQPGVMPAPARISAAGRTTACAALSPVFPR